jgi:hypothetical protein
MLSHPVGSVSHVVHPGESRTQNINALFFMLGWDLYGFYKKCAGTRYAALVFLHPVGSTGHLLHAGAFDEQNVNTLFSFLGGPSAVSIKTASGHVTVNLCFCIQ